MNSTITPVGSKHPYTAQPVPQKSLKQAGIAQPVFRGHQDTASISKSADEPQIPEALRKNIESAAAVLYGKQQAPEVTRKVIDIIQKARQNRPADLLKEDFERPADWYKNEHVYMLYPERFGTENNQPTTFKNLIPMLKYVKTLGASTVHILPFLKSPGIDAGFDVSDYKTVGEDLGGNQEFEEFLTAARKQGIKVKADLVLNHVSDQHDWFKAALNGDPEKLNYFIHKDREPIPEIKRTKHDGTWAKYKEADGTKTKRRVIFPDASSSHYRKALMTGKENGKEKYFYHTFYPHQVDLNWNNPKVLYEAVDIMAHWANKGVDIFRLDALTFYAKPPNTTGENTPGTHAAVQILSSSLQAMSPRSVIWAEVCQKPTALRRYFGKDSQSVHGRNPRYGRQAHGT
jgi:maltose alpha-D-glucosyltransferase/alpha-amylase